MSCAEGCGQNSTESAGQSVSYPGILFKVPAQVWRFRLTLVGQVVVSLWLESSRWDYMRDADPKEFARDVTLTHRALAVPRSSDSNVHLVAVAVVE